MNKIYFEGFVNLGSFYAIADQYPFFSYRKKTEPNAGSPCFKTEKLNPQQDERPVRFVHKRNGDKIVYYPSFVLKFWKDRSTR